MNCSLNVSFSNVDILAVFITGAGGSQISTDIGERI